MEAEKVSLKEHFNVRLDEQEKRVKLALDALTISHAKNAATFSLIISILALMVALFGVYFRR